jgi:hypothetical protein
MRSLQSLVAADEQASHDRALSRLTSPALGPMHGQGYQAAGRQ